MALQAGYHEGAILHADQAAQCALKGLLHGVGQQAKARGHGLVQLAAACSDLVARRTLAVVEEHWRLLETAQDDGDDEQGVDR